MTSVRKWNRLICPCVKVRELRFFFFFWVPTPRQWDVGGSTNLGSPRWARDGHVVPAAASAVEEVASNATVGIEVLGQGLD